MIFKEGKAYKVKFKDHTIGLGRVVTCSVLGYCIKDSEESVTLSHWLIVEEDDLDLIKNNYEFTTLLKSTILSKRVIP